MCAFVVLKHVALDSACPVLSGTARLVSISGRFQKRPVLAARRMPADAEITVSYCVGLEGPWAGTFDKDTSLFAYSRGLCECMRRRRESNVY